MNTPYVHINVNSSVNLTDNRFSIEKAKNIMNRVDQMIAIIKFARGPANATKNIALFLFLKLYGLTGTGLPIQTLTHLNKSIEQAELQFPAYQYVQLD